jgi:hypothetical protein
MNVAARIAVIPLIAQGSAYATGADEPTDRESPQMSGVKRMVEAHQRHYRRVHWIQRGYYIVGLGPAPKGSAFALIRQPDCCSLSSVGRFNMPGVRRMSRRTRGESRVASKVLRLFSHRPGQRGTDMPVGICGELSSGLVSQKEHQRKLLCYAPRVGRKT